MNYFAFSETKVSEKQEGPNTPLRPITTCLDLSGLEREVFWICVFAAGTFEEF